MQGYPVVTVRESALSDSSHSPVLAVVGLTGTGKSEATQLLAARFGYSVVYFGGVVIDEVRRRGLPVIPEHEREVREELRAREGMDVMATRSLDAIRSGLATGPGVAIDGLYSAAELTRLRAEFGDRLVTIAVHSARWLRKERLAVRPKRPLTSKEVDERDHFELTKLDKAIPIAAADLHVVNEGTLDDLEAALLAALSRLPAEAGH